MLSSPGAVRQGLPLGFTSGRGVRFYFLVVLPRCERVCSNVVLVSLKVSPMSLLSVVLIMTSYPWAVGFALSKIASRVGIRLGRRNTS